MRIICFGCSLTFGEGITKVDLYEKPSEYSWPSVIRRDLMNNTVPVINESIAGASNKLILYKIMNFDYEPNDIVCVQYTYAGRDSIFKKQIANKSEINVNNIHFINPSAFIRKTEIAERYYEIYDNYSLLINDLIYVNSCYNFLQNNNIKYTCRFASNLMYYIDNENILFKSNYKFQEDQHLKTIQNISELIDERSRYGHDGSHYSIEVNELIAKDYYKSITNMI